MNDFARILKKDVIRISPQESLAGALSKLTTSHDAGFVFSDEDKFMGVVNPYYDLIKSSFPGNAKVEHCLFHPPHIYSQYSLSKIAKLIIESKIHYLPVFDDKNRFEGIISARRILSQFKDSPIFHVKISEILQHKNKQLITISQDDPVNTAIHLFKTTRLSKLIVIGKDMKLKGVLSYYDLISYLVSPKNGEHRGDRVGNKIGFYHQNVRTFVKTYVLTLTPSHLLSDALHLILEKKIGSVVIVDHEKHPIGIITTRDFLRLLIKDEREKKIQFIGKNLSDQSRHIVGGFFKHLQRSIKKFPDIASARLFVHEAKKGGLFNVNLFLKKKNGKPIIFKEEGKNLKKTLKKIKKHS